MAKESAHSFGYSQCSSFTSFIGSDLFGDFGHLRKLCLCSRLRWRLLVIRFPPGSVYFIPCRCLPCQYLHIDLYGIDRWVRMCDCAVAVILSRRCMGKIQPRVNYIGPRSQLPLKRTLLSQRAQIANNFPWPLHGCNDCIAWLLLISARESRIFIFILDTGRCYRQS